VHHRPCHGRFRWRVSCSAARQAHQVPSSALSDAPCPGTAGLQERDAAHCSHRPVLCAELQLPGTQGGAPALIKLCGRAWQGRPRTNSDVDAGQVVLGVLRPLHHNVWAALIRKVLDVQRRVAHQPLAIHSHCERTPAVGGELLRTAATSQQLNAAEMHNQASSSRWAW
jgi:hypothetical protein